MIWVLVGLSVLLVILCIILAIALIGIHESHQEVREKLTRVALQVTHGSRAAMTYDQGAERTPALNEEPLG